MLELILGIVPSVIGLITDNKEVVEVVTSNKEVATGIVGAFVVDLGLRLVPTKNHRSVIIVAIAVLEGLLAGAKKIDEKLAVRKKQ